MMKALVVADDYTGAMDTGYGFTTQGRSVQVLLYGPEDGEVDPSTIDRDILVIDANTRNTDPQTAKQTVSELFDVSSTVFYKKIDSTLRGNLVAEIEGAIDATKADLTIVAPAFPSTGRITVSGLHLVDGIPLSEARYNVSSSNLSTVFDSIGYQVTSLGIETAAAGADAVRSELTTFLEGAPTIITCDAAHERHLKTVASAAQSLAATVLFVGSGGLASAVSVPNSPPAQPQRNTKRPDGGILAVVGSINNQTLEQLAAVPDKYVHRIDPADAVREPRHAGRKAAVKLKQSIKTHSRTVVTAATDSTDVERAHDAAADLESDVDVGDRIVMALATAASDTARVTSLAGLFLTGGLVARTVLDELSTTTINLTGEIVEDGIPEGRIVDGVASGTHVVTKAGGFGSKGSIINCLKFLDGSDGRC